MNDEKLKKDIRDLLEVIADHKGFLISREGFAREIIDILKEVSKVSAEINHRDFHFVATHNQIVNNLNHAEKEHLDTLESFLTLLKKRSDKVLEITPQIERFNTALEDMALKSDHIATSLTKLNAATINAVQYLSSWEEKTNRKFQTVMKGVMTAFLRKTSWILILNGLFTSACLIAVYIMTHQG